MALSPASTASLAASAAACTHTGRASAACASAVARPSTSQVVQYTACCVYTGTEQARSPWSEIHLCKLDAVDSRPQQNGNSFVTAAATSGESSQRSALCATPGSPALRQGGSTNGTVTRLYEGIIHSERKERSARRTWVSSSATKSCGPTVGRPSSGAGSLVCCATLGAASLVEPAAQPLPRHDCCCETPSVWVYAIRSWARRCFVSSPTMHVTGPQEEG